MATHDLSCWRCGADLGELSLPLGRLDECTACTIPLHVCRMCVHFDPGVARQCREDDAEEVREKERPNFCDYFRPSTDAFDPAKIDAETRARGELESLFSTSEAPAADGSSADDPLSKAESLFRKD